MKRLRVWRLRRAYRRVQRLEVALGFSEEVLQLRALFSRQTLAVTNRVMKQRGVSRGLRRTFLRQMTRTNG